MPANVKNVILKKKISDTIYELRCKTIAAMVYVDDNTTLASQLTTMLADISDTATKMSALLDGAQASSIATQISTAISTAVNAIEDDTDPTSIAGKLAAAQTAINAINDASTGILATAEAYTDTVAGISGTGYSTVKAYVDNAISTVTSDLAGAFHFKGSVNYVDLLPDPTAPSSTVEEGDVYQVVYRGTSTDAGTDPLNAEYAYNGTAFVELGTIVDLSSYSTTAQMTSAIGAAQTAAEQTAAADATSKANAAQAAAEATAAADATSKANAAQAAAEATAAADATSKANAAQAAAEQTAATALQSAVQTINTSIATKARIILSTTQPADLTESDIWAQVIEDTPAEDPEEP